MPRFAIAPLGLTTEGSTKFKLKVWKCYLKKLQCNSPNDRVGASEKQSVFFCSSFCGQSMTCDPGGGATLGVVGGGEDFKGNRRRRGAPTGSPEEADNCGDHSDHSVNDSTLFAARDTGIGRPGKPNSISISLQTPVGNLPVNVDVAEDWRDAQRESLTGFPFR